MPSAEASRRNLAAAKGSGRLKRLRSDRESAIIKLLIWQWYFDREPKLSQRALARQLGVRQPYIWRVLLKARSEGMDALLQYGRRVTLDDLADARRFTARVREAEPDMLAPVAEQPDELGAKTVDENIAETWREVREWKRKHPMRHDTRRRIRVPVRW